ncbi:MAG: cysteine--tRNA ligase [Verrucomicrobiae bacterium]|nr:cysteine--tRNA ligase [Verrucomicrobiae bacterium]MCP5541879.1 cysteine--tRNA ligase [Akkermansiaceae bacterium]
MKLHDTLSRTVRDLRPRDGRTFRFYCCGPTVYGPAHIGNFRTFVLQDVFRRTIELSGVPTRHVRNLTDVDDKTIRDSQAAGQTLVEFTRHWTERFHEDCAKLNLLPPHEEPGAVGHIPQQIALIEALMEKGHAYRSEDGSVYYKVSSFGEYGKLSHLDRRELRLGAAVADDEYEKDSVADFALWKARKPEDGDNWWDSPWGPGRPGWHLECSAMCREYLGETFDLHSGGVDLIFPHHENEIAQSEAATGHPMADHWFHLTHLLVDGGKMSKSLGNFHTLDQIEAAGFTGNDLRYALISAHYRQPLNFVARDKEGKESFPSLAGARQALERIAKFDAALRERFETQQGTVADSTGYDQLRALPEADRGAFAPAFEALLNDLNTPDALGRVFSAIREGKPAELSPDEALREWRGLRFVMEALGLRVPEPDRESAEIPEAVRALAEKRWAARAAKDWATADSLRAELGELGWEMKDGREGYELAPKG